MHGTIVLLSFLVHGGFSEALTVSPEDRPAQSNPRHVAIATMGPHLVTEGSTLQMTCSVVCQLCTPDPSHTSLPNPRIQWTGPKDFADLEHYPVSQNEVDSGHFQSSLLVPEVSPKMQGLYSCRLVYTFMVDGEVHNDSLAGPSIRVIVERLPLDKFTWTLLALVGFLSLTVTGCLLFILHDRLRTFRCRRRSESKESIASKRTQRSDTRSLAKPSPLPSFTQTVELPTVPMNSPQSSSAPSDVLIPDRSYPVKRPQRLGQLSPVEGGSEVTSTSGYFAQAEDKSRRLFNTAGPSSTAGSYSGRSSENGSGSLPTFTPISTKRNPSRATFTGTFVSQLSSPNDEQLPPFPSIF